MSHKRLVHHLRSYRKIAGFSQKELAHLLGWKSEPRVSEHEHFQRLPSLRTAIAYEVVFRTPLKTLLPGLYEDVARSIGRRAQILAAGVSPRQRAKLALLRALTDVSTPDIREA